MPTSIGRARVQELAEAGAAIVDVLPPGEYEKSRLPGAISIPLPKLDREATAGLDRDRPVVVYCFDTQ